MYDRTKAKERNDTTAHNPTIQGCLNSRWVEVRYYLWPDLLTGTCWKQAVPKRGHSKKAEANPASNTVPLKPSRWRRKVIYEDTFVTFIRQQPQWLFTDIVCIQAQRNAYGIHTLQLYAIYLETEASNRRSIFNSLRVGYWLVTGDDEEIWETTASFSCQTSEVWNLAICI